MTLHRIGPHRITIGLGLAISALIGALMLPAAGTAHANSGRTCQRTSVPVTLQPTEPTHYRLAGWLCSRGRPDGKPYRSCSRASPTTTPTGTAPTSRRATPTLTQRWTGRAATRSCSTSTVSASATPTTAPAPLVTVASEAWVAHQLVQALRHGGLGHTRYATVIGVGHSMGSAMWIYEAAQYHDVDALVLTSYLHQPNVTHQQAIAATLQPADRDPTFAARNLPAGYYTSASGAATRIADFYSPADTDPAMAATDEALKQTATSGERATLDLARDPTYSRHITVPVLIVVGQDDALAATRPRPRLPRRRDHLPQGSTGLLSSSPPGHVRSCRRGHSINLHRNAATWFAVAARWINQAITQSRQPRPRARRLTQTPPGTSPTAPPANTPCADPSAPDRLS